MDLDLKVVPINFRMSDMVRLFDFVLGSCAGGCGDRDEGELPRDLIWRGLFGEAVVPSAISLLCGTSSVPELQPASSSSLLASM